MLEKMFRKSSRNRSVKWFSSCAVPAVATTLTPSACQYSKHAQVLLQASASTNAPNTVKHIKQARLSPLDVMKEGSSRVLGTGL